MSKLRGIPFLAACFAVFLGVMVLFAGEPRGLADNGDFNRVLKNAGIAYPADADPLRTHYNFHDLYEMSPSPASDAPAYVSTHLPAVALSKWLSAAWNAVSGQPPTRYSLGFLAGIYLVLMGLGVYLVLSALAGRPLWMQILAAVALLLVVCDEGNLLYFRSFYGEPFQFVTFLLAFGLFFRALRSKRPGWIALYFLAVFLFCGAKTANLPLLLPLSVPALLFWTGQTRRKVVAGASCALSLLGGVLLYTAVPPWMDRVTTYQSVFFGVLKDYPHPAEALNQMGLSYEYAPLAGTHGYQSDYPLDVHSAEFEAGFYDKTTRLTVAGYYLTHPSRLARKLAVSCRQSAYLRPVYLGNFGETHPRAEQSHRFTLWEDTRVGLGLTDPLFVLCVFAVSVGVVVFLWKTNRRRAGAALLCLLLCAAYQLGAPVVLNGESDLQKHMYGFNQIFDLLLLSLLGGLVSALRAPVRRAWTRRWPVYAAGAAALLLIVGLFAFGQSPEEVVWGRYQGQPVRWLVLERRDGAALLLCKEPLGLLPFDPPDAAEPNAQRGRFGGNRWRDSFLRSYLNALPLPVARETTRRVFLSDVDRKDAEGGTRYLPFSFRADEPAYVYSGAPFETVTDRVFLPGLEILAQYANNPAWRCAVPCFLETPMGSNAAMVRVLMPDGSVLFQDAAEPAGVRPMVWAENV